MVVEPTDRLRVAVAHSVGRGEREVERVGEVVEDRERLTVMVTQEEAVKVLCGMVGEWGAVERGVKVGEREGVMDWDWVTVEQALWLSEPLPEGLEE